MCDNCSKDYPVTDKEKVAKGATLLDEKGPANWRQKINPDTLNIMSGEDCILGQLYGTYIKGCCALGLDLFTGQTSDRGFANPGTQILEEWKEEITRVSVNA